MVGVMTSRYDAFVGTSAGPPRHAVDPVNLPAIRRFVEAIDDRNPIYLSESAAVGAGRDHIVAPPAMLSVWVAKGYRETISDDSPRVPALEALAADGFTVTPGTNLRHRYRRELTVGDVISAEGVVTAISGEKLTPIGPGHFVTTTSTFTDAGGDPVGEQSLTVFAYRPGGPRSHATRTVPAPPEGDEIEPLPITLDRLGVIVCSAACGGYRSGHYDPDEAKRRGLDDIFTDIPTSSALVARYTTDHFGPRARLRELDVRLGVPFYARDTLVLRGWRRDDTLQVEGRTSNGLHIAATVKVEVL